MDKTSKRKIIDNHIRALEGQEFQNFGDRLCLKLYPGDYTPVRAAGPKGDMKNDGYCPKARIFFAAHATRGERISNTKDKVMSDLEGCLIHHSDVQQWVYLTNDTLPGEVETFIDERLRPAHPDVTIDVWGYKQLGEMLAEMSIADIERILEINLATPSTQRTDIPVVMIDGLGRTGGSHGHTEIFTLKNVGKEAAIAVRLMVVGEDYSWSSPARRNLAPNEVFKNVEYPISAEPAHLNDVPGLRAMIEYEDTGGNTITTFHDLEQETVPSGLFKILKLGKFHPPETTAPYSPHSSEQAAETGSTPPAPPKMLYTLAGFEALVDASAWTKEAINQHEIWVAKNNALFQIQLTGESDNFTEPWTQIYPDSLGSGKFNVDLTIAGVIIRQLLFVYCDGGRIRVPLPRIKIVGEERKFYWDSSSLEYKIGKLIGSFYIYGGIEGVAAMSKIDIV